LFFFIFLAPPNVKASYFPNAPTSTIFDAVFSWSSYPNSPTMVDYNDDFLSLEVVEDNFVIRLQAMFVAPVTG